MSALPEVGSVWRYRDRSFRSGAGTYVRVAEVRKGRGVPLFAVGCVGLDGIIEWDGWASMFHLEFEPFSFMGPG